MVMGSRSGMASWAMRLYLISMRVEPNIDNQSQPSENLFCSTVTSGSLMEHPPYNTFRETLAFEYPDCGYALWDPSPSPGDDTVEVGDVGVIRDGCFRRLFNVFLPGDHPSHQNFGVPEYHQPLRFDAQTSIHKGVESRREFYSRYVNMSRERDLHVHSSRSRTKGDSNVTLSCTGMRGAALSLPVPARCEDTIATGHFGRWMIKYIDHWFAFAKSLGLEINHMQDIILVTGCHRAKSWVNVAFSPVPRNTEVSFGVQLSGESNVKIEPRRVPYLPGDAVLNLGPNGENLPENQCIFVRGFRVVRIPNIYPRLRGQVGPGPNRPDQQPQPIGISNDPLHILLQYIAERAPGCDMALVHDEDLARIAIPSHDPGSFRTDGMIEHLRDAVPEIRQIKCDSFPGNKRNAEAVVLTRVAMLPKDEFPWGAVNMLSNMSSIDNDIATYGSKLDYDMMIVLAALFSGTILLFLQTYNVLSSDSNDYIVHFCLMGLALNITCIVFTILCQRLSSFLRKHRWLSRNADVARQTHSFSSLGIKEYLSRHAVAIAVILLCFSSLSFLAVQVELLHTRSKTAAIVIKLIAAAISMSYIMGYVTILW